MTKDSPTRRSLLECRERGWDADVVERFIPGAIIRRDLFGIIDIIALTPTHILGIQATSDSNHAARVAKARDNPVLPRFIRAGGVFHVWSWGRKGKPRTRKLWTLREDDSLYHEIRARLTAHPPCDACGFPHDPAFPSCRRAPQPPAAAEPA